MDRRKNDGAGAGEVVYSQVNVVGQAGHGRFVALTRVIAVRRKT